MNSVPAAGMQPSSHSVGPTGPAAGIGVPGGGLARSSAVPAVALADRVRGPGGPLAGEPLEAWRRVWRIGFAPHLGLPQLESLRDGLAADAPGLIQGETARGAWGTHDRAEACACACALGYALWRGDGLETVGEVLDAFAALCGLADRALGGRVACAPFLEWFDDSPREEVRRQLLPEVERALALKREALRLARRVPPGTEA